MDRRSWLWRRKSSEKGPNGETESSGSLSSHSERFSDDQTLSNLNTQSPEVTSKDIVSDEQELNKSVKSLSEKLSDALLDIQAKEDLVKQHAKVAEEAVSGWEKAENEVIVLKKQNDGLNQKNLILEERVGHLDGALKECLRQLRLAREEQEEKVYDAVVKKTAKWESERSRLVELQNAKEEAYNAQLEENSILKKKLVAKDEDLEITKRERDLSVQAAEAASKQHLDSIKKVAKLQAECRRLNFLACKATVPTTVQSVCDESQLDSGERLLAIEYDVGKMCPVSSQKYHQTSRLIFPSVEIDLMDDFLEMEKLASVQETHSRRSDEQEAMITRMSELETSLKKITEEKLNLEIALDESHIQLRSSEHQLNQTKAELSGLKSQLALAQKEIEASISHSDEAEARLEVMITRMSKLETSLKKITEEKLNLEVALDESQIQLQSSEDRLKQTEAELSGLKTQLALAQNEVEETKLKLQTSIYHSEEAEARRKVMELEINTLQSSICTLEKVVEEERNHSTQAAAKIDKLEAEITRFQRSSMINEPRINQDKEQAIAASKFAECQQTIASLREQLQSLATLEEFLID